MSNKIRQKRQISWAIIYPLCNIKSPLNADIPDKLNSTSCNSSPTMQMEASEQSQCVKKVLSNSPGLVDFAMG